MIALFILLILLACLTWVFIAPIRLVIDTQNQLYQAQWKGIANAVLVPLSGDFLIRLRILFWKKDIYPLHAPVQKKLKQSKKESRTKKKKPFEINKFIKKGKRFLKSFEVKIFKLNLDTDDYVYNSYLYPIFYFLNNEHRQLKINYQGEQELQLEIENRLYRLMIALFF